MHKVEKQEYNRKYHQSHKQERNEYHKKYKNNRRKIDINFKILCNLRTQILHILKKNLKSSSTMFLIGCSVEYLIYHIQCKFTKGMNWDNRGNGYGDNGKKEWQVDHMKPCSSFDLSKPSEQRKCFHYTNLQPLWATDNRKKGNKYKEKIKCDF